MIFERAANGVGEMKEELDVPLFGPYLTWLTVYCFMDFLRNEMEIIIKCASYVFAYSMDDSVDRYINDA